MAAIIRTYLNGDLSTVIEGASREDLRPGDVVHCEAVEGAITGEGYRWTLAFTPDSLDGTPSASTLTSELDSTTTFTVDNEGAYLLRLVTDPNTKHESTQFVRLRFLTKFGSLKLVAAGERRDGTGIVPVDVSTEGWANDQNYNLQELLKHISRTAISSRVLYVDANRGNDNSHAQNTEEAEDYGDFWKIQDAIDEAVSGSHCGVPAASETPWMIIIRPGRYVENLTIPPGIHLIGLPTGVLNNQQIIETVGNGAAHKISGAGEVLLSGLYFHTDDNTLTDPILHVEDTTVIMNRVDVENTSAAASVPPALYINAAAHVEARECYFDKGVGGKDDQYVVAVMGHFSAWKTKVTGKSCFMGAADSSIKLNDCRVKASGLTADFGAITSFGEVVVEDSKVEAQSGFKSITMNPTGEVVSDLKLRVRRSHIDGMLAFNDAGSVAQSLHLSSVEIEDSDLDFDTTASWFNAKTTGESVYFNADKTPLGSSLLAAQLDSSVAGNIQEAVDRALALALSVVTLGDAYNGVTDHTGHPFVRGDGAGNRIVADAVDEFGVGIPVQITDSDAPGAEAGIGETKGRLQVVSNVEVGAVDAPEIIANPNPYGLGPVLSMGRTVWDASHFPAAVVEANTDSDTGRHYGLRLQTKSGDGGGEIGSVIIQAGDHTSAAQDGGSVHISAGAGNSGGDITFWPGFLAGGGDAGKILLLGGGHRNQDPTLTAPDAFAGGVAGTVVFGSAITGTFTLEIAATTTLNEICTGISSTTPLTGINDGGKLAIQVSDKSLKAEPFIVSVSSPELNTALGDLLNYTVVHADQAEFQFALQVPVDNEIHLGVDGAAGPMTYNSETGALNVPGAIAAASLETTGDLVVGGDLTVMGDSTIAYTSTVQVEDKNLELGTIEGGGETDATADGGGITIKGATDKTLVWDQATNAFSVNTNFTVPSGKIGVGLDGMATPEPQKTLYVHTENDGDGFLVENSHDGSKFLVDYSAGNGTNAQLFDDSNTRTVFVRSYGDSWFNAGNIGIGTESPSKLFHVETDADGEGVFVGNTSNGSKFLVDYSMGNGINTQLFDETNTRTIFFRSYGNSWFVNTVSIGTDTPVAGKALTVDGDVAIDGDLDVTGTITASGIVGPVVQTHVIVSAIDYDVVAEDYFVVVNTDAAGGEVHVWLDPAIAAGRALVIKNKGGTHGVSIATGSIADGFSAGSAIDDDPVCFLPPKEAVNLVCNGGEDWSIF